MEEEMPTEEIEAQEPYYEIEKLLRWRDVKRGQQIRKEYLVLWNNYPIDWTV